jgi:hypothetical protein
VKRSDLVQQMRRWGKRLLFAIGGSYLAYLVLANVALAVGLVPHVMNLRPTTVHVSYAYAWTWLPGRVHAHELRVVGSDSALQWQFDLDDVTAQVSMLDLFHRQVSASHVRARGVVARVRRKLDPAAATHDALSMLPPIDGLSTASVVGGFKSDGVQLTARFSTVFRA